MSIPGITLCLSNGHDYLIKLRHEPMLRQLLMGAKVNEKQRVEFESVFGDGRLVCKLGDIDEFFVATESFLDEQQKYRHMQRVLGEED